MLIIGFFAGIAYAEPDTNSKQFDFKKAYFYNFYSVCPLSSGEVCVVGSHGIICAFDKKLDSCVVQNSGTFKTLFSVSFPDPKNGWIAGQDGLILHTDDGGKTWTPQTSNTTEHLFSVCFKDPNTGWIIGAFGTLLHTSDGGKNWSQQGEKIDCIYNKVFFVDKLHGWIVGEFGTILGTKDGGNTWAKQENPLGEGTLFDVFFKDQSEGWITGMDGKALVTSDGGANWMELNSPIKEHLLSIQVIGDTGWAVGLKGTYAMLKGSSWVDFTQKIPTRAWLKQCFFVDSKTGWIVGSVGTILRTTDGGQTWEPPWQGLKK